MLYIYQHRSVYLVTLVSFSTCETKIQLVCLIKVIYTALYICIHVYTAHSPVNTHDQGLVFSGGDGGEAIFVGKYHLGDLVHAPWRMLHIGSSQRHAYSAVTAIY